MLTPEERTNLILEKGKITIYRIKYSDYITLQRDDNSEFCYVNGNVKIKLRYPTEVLRDIVNNYPFVIELDQKQAQAANHRIIIDCPQPYSVTFPYHPYW